MKFPWSREENSARLFGRAAAPASNREEQKCPALDKILQKILRQDKPEILDLGPFCGATAIFLADRGARVSVEELVPPPPLPEPSPGKKLSGEGAAAEPPPPIRLEQPDGQYDLVLVWEFCDFIPTKRLPEFGRELHRVLREGGWALLLSISDPPHQKQTIRRPPRYRVVAEDQVVREACDGPDCRRYAHNPRDIERALAPLAVQGIHLQRNQLREFTMFKRR